MLITTTLTACNEAEQAIPTQATKLNINVQTAKIETRGLIESASLPDGHSIGLALTDAGGSTYDNISYSNIQATASTGATPQTWTLASDILLSSTDGTLYAYYPYNSAVTDITQIPVTAGDTDYMYATPVNNLNDGNYSPTVTMNHALAAIRLNIVKGTYTGTGAVTSVSISGDNIATSGLLNAKTGVLSSLSGTGSAVTNSTAFTLSNTAMQIDCIIVPVTNTSAAPTITMTIDGKEYIATPSAVTLEQGSIYQYTLTVDAKDISLSDIKVGDWGYNTSGNISVDMGYDVTLAGTLTDIAFSNTVSGEVLTIKAVPMTDGYYVNEVTKTGTATLSQSLDETTGIRTVTMSGVASDVTVTFAGTAKMEKHLAAADASTGVYAVYKSGDNLYLHTYDQVDTDKYTYLGVGLIVTDAPTPQYLIIEKNGEANTTSIQAAYTADGASNTDYTYFYWGMNVSDIYSITNYTSAISGSSYGYIPLIDGTYYGTSATQLGAYTTWTGSYALNDWNGKANTAAIQFASDTDSNTTYANMATYCTKFNATASENQGYTDWYIPSCGQLALIQMYTGRAGDSKVVSEGINEMLTKIGGTTFDTSFGYWSSSEYDSDEGWRVSFYTGGVDYYQKYDSFRVRLVRDFVITANFISFKVGKYNYIAEEGMTWEEFINSNYNKFNFKISNNTAKILLQSGYYGNVQLNDIDVLSTDPIISGASYSTVVLNPDPGVG